jgi:hypothetical protein
MSFTNLLLQVVAGITPFGFHMANPALGPTETELDLAFMEARSVCIVGASKLVDCRRFVLFVLIYYSMLWYSKD